MTYNKDYYVDSDISNYKDYRKRIFSHQADSLIDLLSLDDSNSILDFGCATGGLLYEFKNYGYTRLRGVDISTWAISYGKHNYGLEDELFLYDDNVFDRMFDYVFMFDVLEHMETEEIRRVLGHIQRVLSNKFLVRIPVSKKEGENYYYEVSRNDKTHIQIHCKEWWINLITSHGFKFHDYIITDTIYDSDGVFCGIFTNGDYND